MPCRKNLAARGLAAAAALFLCQCMYGDEPNGGTAFRQINLVTDTDKYLSQTVDTNLVNPWGLAASLSGDLWVANNGNGMATIYDGGGDPQMTPVRVPGAGGGTGAPTGMVANPTAGFPLPGGGKAQFLFAGEDGTVSAWSSGQAAVIVIDRSASGAVYKGLTLGKKNGADFLYLANFHAGTVEVFNASFQMDSTGGFRDTTLPAGFAPFNVIAVENEIFVTYAKQLMPEKVDDEPGAGNGYVNIFRPDGSFLRRFASEGQLNSPWGFAASSGYFGPFFDAIFIGNFGDGIINAFETGGRPLGRVQEVSGRIVMIQGLWALYWAQEGGFYGEDRLYFTAGPDKESHGIFGYFLAF